MATIREALSKRIEKGETDDKKIIQAVTKQLGVNPTSVRNMLTRIRRDQPTSGRSLAEFKQTYDKNTIIPQKIKKALKELGAAWEYEAEFIKRAGVNYTDINTFRDMFDGHVVVVKRESKKIWCGTAAFANQLKELI
jgi:hypothetical protein